jgi:hypothetical protein
MTDNRIGLSSLGYWNQSQSRVAQRFYVAFCLLMSSVQDYLLGLWESEHHNLNWSATCSYYSLVHGGRLLCFLALGDFPKSHATLRNLLAGANTPRSNERARPDGYPFDWLRDFTNTDETRSSSGSSLTSIHSDLRKAIVEYFDEVEVVNARCRLDHFGKLLRNAAPLRNDSNYEALLIAHEFDHELVSVAFEKLCKSMSSAAEVSLPFLIDAFNGFRRRDPDFPEDRRPFESFLRVYKEQRIAKAIQRKICDVDSVRAKMEELLALLDVERTDSSYKQIEDWVSVDIFGMKSWLMNEFKSKIKCLSDAICL